MPDKDWEICFSKFDNTSSDRSHAARCSRAVRVTVSVCCQMTLSANSTKLRLSERDTSYL